MNVIVTPVFFCLGDSLTLCGTGTVPTPWPQRLHLNLFTASKAVGNQGKSGDTVAQMQSRYTSEIRGQGFTAGSLMGGTNDLELGGLATTIFATLSTLVATMISDGLKVLLCTVPPTNGFVGWTGAKQTQLEALNTSIRALTGTGLTILDTYALLGSSGDPTRLAAANDFGDRRHLSQAGCDTQAAAALPTFSTW